METLKIFTNKIIRNVLFSISFALSALLNFIFLFTKTSYSGESIIKTANPFVVDSNYIPAVCAGIILFFGIFVICSLISLIINFTKKNALVWPALTAVICSAASVTLNYTFSVNNLGILLVLCLVINIGWLIYATICAVAHGGFKKPTKGDFTPLKRRASVIMGGCFAVCLSLLYFPACYYSGGGKDYVVAPMGAFSSDADNTLCLIFLALICVLGLVSIKLFANSLKALTKTDGDFTRAVSPIVTLTAFATGGYFVSGIMICSLNNSKGLNYSTTAYVPFIISLALYITFAFITRRVGEIKIKNAGAKAAKAIRLEFFIYALAAAAVTVAQVFTDIIKVNYIKPADMEGLHLNGYKIFMTYNSLESGFQLVAFVLFAAVCVITTLIIASLICLIRESKIYYKLTLFSLISSGVISLLIGLFGKYYEIVQHINKDAIVKLLQIDVEALTSAYSYKVTAPAFYWFLAVCAVLIVVIIRRPYSKGTVSETPVLYSGAASGSVGGGFGSTNSTKATSNVMEESVLSNPCPAFSEIDGKVYDFEEALSERKKQAFSEPTLQKLTEFIVAYARDSRLHLSYTNEDIAAFIAGLGATRLTILQGMSGTGKTSLPKIFSEAVFGNCEIVEVESSWRDKNELLGYYNEFSKSYTPKKFTQSLYRAVLNPEIITFIVLDEMNLSRVEYYFSDFLSLMENETDKREIKLLNIPLYKNIGGEFSEYLALSEGHTVKIPSNIWFIGTANRDESTFEISDKVYDRAHTMNFNKRAVKPVYYGAPIDKRYLSVDEFEALLTAAKQRVNFRVDNYPLIREVEKLLIPYNISFGNRIANQIEDFVSIYASCFASPESVIFDAVEKILLSKVICKLELKSVENKTALAAEFEKLNILRAAEFVLKLNED